MAHALQSQTRKPLLRSVAVQLDTAELVQRAVRETLAGSQTDLSGALRDKGLPELPEVANLASKLQDALAELERIDQAILGLQAGQDVKRVAGDLVKRYAKARHEQQQALADFSAWLSAAPQDAAPPS